jgi:hypothetical protein
VSGVLEAVERLEGKVAGREVAKFLISCSFKREGRGQVVEVLLRDGVVGDDELTHARGLLVVEVVSYSAVSSATTPINDTRLAKFSLEIVQLIAIHNSSRAVTMSSFPISFHPPTLLHIK